MTPERLGDDLARLVWESFSDYLEHGVVPVMVGGIEADGGVESEGVPGLLGEELLILFLWIHTRACQQALAGRADPDRLRATLDTMHRAVFEDLEAHGMAREELPLFEQRVSARYSEYYGAMDGGAERVCEVAARRVSGEEAPDRQLVGSLAEATVAAAGPLRDFLEDVELTG